MSKQKENLNDNCIECGNTLVESEGSYVCSVCGLVSDEKIYDQIMIKEKEPQKIKQILPKTPKQNAYFKKIHNTTLFFRGKHEPIQIAIDKQMSLLLTMYDLDKGFYYQIMDEANKIPNKFLEDNKIDKRTLVFTIFVSKVKKWNNIKDVIEDVKNVTNICNFKRKALRISFILEQHKMKRIINHEKQTVQIKYIHKIAEIYKHGVMKTNITTVQNQDAFKQILISNGIKILQKIDYNKTTGLNPKTVASYVLYKVANKKISKTDITKIFTITRPTLGYAIKRFEPKGVSV